MYERGPRHAAAKTLKKELGYGGSAAFLTDTQRQDATNAMRIRTERGIKESLSEKVQAYANLKYPLGGDLTVGAAIDDFVGAKAYTRTLADLYRTSLNRLEWLWEAFSERKPSAGAMTIL